jgi:prephenate dehydratase
MSDEDIINVRIQGDETLSFSARALQLFMAGKNYHVTSCPTFDIAAKDFTSNKETIERNKLAGYEACKPSKNQRLFLPTFNSTGRRVEEMDQLLPDLEGWIVDEQYMHVEQYLWTLEGVSLKGIDIVLAMEPARRQCKNNIDRHGWSVHPESDTAGSIIKLYNEQLTNAAAIGPLWAGLAFQKPEQGKRKLIHRGNFCDDKNNWTHWIFIEPPADQEEKCRPEPGIKYVFEGVLFGDLYPRRSKSPFQVFADNGVRLVRNLEADKRTFRVGATLIKGRGHVNDDGMPHRDDEDGYVHKAIAELRELKDAIGRPYEFIVKGCYPEKPRPL